MLKSLNRAVAGNSEIPEWVVATPFWHRVGVDLVRGAPRAFQRRLAGRNMEDMSAGNSYQEHGWLRPFVEL